jgi:hypothetical protein
MASKEAGESLLLGLIASKSFPDSFSADELADVTEYLDHLHQEVNPGSETDVILVLQLPQHLRDQIADHFDQLQAKELQRAAQIGRQVRELELELDGMELLERLQDEDGGS